MDNSIYSSWKPSFTLANTQPHPSIVYESEHMSSVSPPDIDYLNMKLKTQTAHSASFISDVQVEAVGYALHSMENQDSIKNHTRGFFLGDGTGVGKSRTISAIATELFMRNKHNFRALWVSLNKTLELDAKKELDIVRDIGNTCPLWLSLNKIKKGSDGIFFTTYGSLIRDKTYDAVLTWLQNSTNTLLIFDESHTAKSVTSKSGKMVVELQNSINNPRVVYSTATAASDIKQLHYMDRLGLWTGSHSTFVKMLESYGSSAMEMSALQLKHSGKVVSRQLGFDGIHINLKSYQLNDSDVYYYNLLTERWRELNVSNGIDNLNFYQQLITTFKLKSAIEEIKQSLLNDEVVVVGLQTTGEVSCQRNHHSCLLDLFHRHNSDVSDLDFEMNPIDYLLNEFGTENVAEISGRTTRPVKRDGHIIMENVPSTKLEMEAFQSERKKIVIITRSGCAGISLHADQSNGISKKRHHIILEPPRSAELLVQQFGRTHRSNSNTFPHYTIIVTNIPSELRFFHGLTSKLERLGALTKGDRRASLLNNINFEGCSRITTKSYRSFMLELNTQIANSWYQNNKFPELNLNIARLLSGLYHNDYNLVNKERSTIFFTKLLSHLNNYIITLNNLEDNDDIPVMLKWSSREWSYLWKEFANGRTFRMNRVALSCLYRCTLKVMSECLPETKNWILNLKTWTLKNHKLHSKYVKSTVKTILLCQLRPECSNTIGSLPTHLIHDIIPWLIPRNEITQMQQLDIQRCFKNGANVYSKNANVNGFLNSMLEFPIHVQKVVFPVLRQHTASQEIQNTRSVVDLDKFLLGTNSEYNIVYDSYKLNDTNYELNVSAQPKAPLSKLIELFENLQLKSIKFVRPAEHANKFGILTLANDQSKWFCELWYPGYTKPARCFMRHQWEENSHKYIDVTVTKEEWMEKLEKAYFFKIQHLYKHCYRLTFAVSNAISRWEFSTGKLVRVKNTGISPDFIGLLIRQKKIHQ